MFTREDLENRRKQASCEEGWVGHPLNPIGCLYNILTEVSTVVEDSPQPSTSSSSSRSNSNNNANNSRSNNNNNNDSNSSNSEQQNSKRFQHLPIAGLRDSQESYLTMAVEVCLMGLGQQRVMPAGVYAQEKAMKQEKALIASLSSLHMDATRMIVLRKQAVLLLEGQH